MEAALTHRLDEGTPVSTGWLIRLLPSLSDVAFLLPVVILFYVLSGTKTLLSDGDTGWHIRTGEWILQHKSIPNVDLFSYTKPNQPWFAWEWGSAVIFACVHRLAGLGGVTFLTVTVLCVISVLLFRLIRRQCDNDILSLGITKICLCGSTLHWLARPHIFGWLFLLIFSHVLLAAKGGKLERLAYLPIVMLAWTNTHGSFFVGLLLLLTAFLGEAVESLSSGLPWSERLKRLRPYALCGLGCGAATFVNPYGWHLHQHVLSYVTDSKQLASIQDFQSIDFHSGSALFFECMLVPGCAAIVWCLQRKQFAGAMNLALWAHLALVSARNIPIFLFVAAPWVACMFQELFASLQSPARFRKLAASLSEIYHELQPIERIGRWHLASVFGLLLVGLLFARRVAGFEPRFNSDSFPEQAIAVIQTSNPARVFTYDQWGDYLIYRLPSRKVFVDGRSDFYGTRLIDECLHIINARYDWQSDLARFDVDAVLLKTDAPLTTILKQTPGWQVLLDDGSVIFFRKGVPMATRVPVRDKSQRISPVSHNGGNKLGAVTGLQVDGSISNLNTHERRS